jgi:hypothetical protein
LPNYTHQPYPPPPQTHANSPPSPTHRPPKFELPMSSYQFSQGKTQELGY